MQKMLEAKFVEGEFVATPEGTGQIGFIHDVRRAGEPTEVGVRLDRGDCRDFYEDEIFSCEKVAQPRGETIVNCEGRLGFGMKIAPRER